MGAFILTGEGARGAFQAGVMHNLEKQGIVPDTCYGISSGAVNALGRSYLTPDELCGLWMDVKGMEDVFKFNWWKFWYAKGLFNLKPAQKIARKIITGRKPTTRSVIFRADAMNGWLEFMDSDSFKGIPDNVIVNYLMDAITISGLVEGLSGTYVDAGAVELNPLGKAITDGHRQLHVILGRPINVQKWAPKGKTPKFMQYAFRSLDLSMHQMMMDDIERYRSQLGIEITIYEPRTMPYDQLDFSDCPKMVKMGLEGFVAVPV